ncbi:MAG: SBBP repeat-containing protein [Acidobacteriota bacterium]
MKKSDLGSFRRVTISVLAIVLILIAPASHWAKIGQIDGRSSAGALSDADKTAGHGPENPSQSISQPDEATLQRLTAAYAKSPLRFEANQGQMDKEVKFISQGDGYTLFLTSSEAVLALRQKSDPRSATGGRGSLARTARNFNPLRLRLIGGNKTAEVKGLDQLPTTANYFTGDDPARWRVNVPNYAKAEYQDVYPGVNLVYYGNQGQLEYDFIVSPGTDPGQIRLAFDGAKSLKLDANGDLIVCMPGGEMRQHRPVVYQEINGQRRSVSGEYVIRGDEVRFAIGDYDHSLSLTIDPVLAYSTFLGGSRQDSGQSIAVDAAGNAYIAGYTESLDFPAVNQMIPVINTSLKVLVIKLNATGSGAPVYTTLVGGRYDDWANAIAVDAAGNAYVTGRVSSTSFPIFPTGPAGSAAQPKKAGNDDAFVLKLNPVGNQLLYSTFLGGSGTDEARGIAVDAAGNAYVAGQTISSNFPLKNAMLSNLRTSDAFVTKVNPTGTQFIYSTYLGGSGRDDALGVAVDAKGSAYVTGYSDSDDFPSATWLPARRAGHEEDAFVAKVNPAGNGLVYATLLSGSRDDRGRAIAVDSAQQVCVTGTTISTDFPLMNAIQKNYGGNQDAFVARLSASGRQLVQSTYLGGSLRDAGNGIALDPADNVYVAGLTWSTNFPVAKPIQPNNRGKGDAFVTKFNSALTRLEYSTYLGGGTHKGSSADEAFGIAVDSSGTAYITGQAASPDFPTAGPLQAEIRADWQDVFVAKLYDLAADTLAIKSITSNHGGDTGSATVYIHGVGFLAGAAVKLVRAGQSDISGQPVKIREAGRVILTSFDLRGKARGQWDVVATNPDGRTAILEKGFTVEEGCAPKITANLVGSSSMIRNRKQRYQLQYRNSCNTDAFVVPVIVTLPPHVTATLPTLPARPPQSGNNPVDTDAISPITMTDQGSVVGVIIPAIPPDSSGSIPIDLIVDTLQPIEPTVQTLAPMIDPATGHPSSDLECITHIVRETLLNMLGEYIEHRIKGCLGQIAGLALDSMAGSYFEDPKTYFSFMSFQYSIGATLMECIGLIFPEAELIRFGVTLEKFGKGFYQAIGTLDACKDLLGPKTAWLIRLVASFDPNEKIGPAGIGSARYLSGDDPLSYWIHFENVKEASAPAQEVFVTDQLDPKVFDLRTFKFGAITFGDHQVKPTIDEDEYITTVDLRPARSLLVNVSAKLNPSTGLVTWRLTSLDPETGEPPQDPAFGFLPPNQNPPEGDGSVSFTVKLKKELTSGADIRNSARITFDQNAPLETPAWLNKLDETAPASSVAALAPLQAVPTFKVQWSGTDANSGIRDYTIYVSTNGGSYSTWLKETTATSGDFSGQAGKSYRFYSVARDQVGNVETRPSSPDATTTVSSGQTPAPQLASVSPVSTTAGGPAFTLTVNGTNFVNGAKVRWNGADKTTTFVSATELKATIPAADIAASGAASITVFNPAPGGGVSNALPFTINPSNSNAEQEPNETSAQATSLPLPGKRTGVVAAGNAAYWVVSYQDGTKDGLEDLFALTVTQSSVIELTLTAANAAADLDLFLFKEENGSLSYLGYSLAGPGVEERIVTASALAPGRYLVAVSAFSGSSSYTLTTATPDSRLLSLGFNNTLTGAQGEAPLLSTNVSFGQGVSGAGLSLPVGNQLFYGSAGNFNATEGTIDLWIKPNWNGNDSKHHYIVQHGGAGGLLIGKDSANNLRLMLNRYGAAGGAEIDTGFNIADWRANQWYHVAFTWSSSQKAVRIYVNGVMKSNRAFNQPLPAINSDRLQIGGDGAGSYLEAVIDELGIHGIALTADQIAARYQSP